MSRVAFTVDVEQDAPPYLVTWRGMKEGMPLLLSLLEAHGIRSTFFVTAEAGSRFSETVAVAASQHEIGCHGYDHTRLDRISRDDQRKQICAATAVLQRLAGTKPTGFRAPNFKYTDDTLRILSEIGYEYDASRAIYHRGPISTAAGLRQIANTFPSSVLRLPWRLSGPLLRCALKTLPLVVLDFHPWELVPVTGLRPDITYATGEKAVQRLDAIFSRLKSWGAAFVTLEQAVRDRL